MLVYKQEAPLESLQVKGADPDVGALAAHMWRDGGRQTPSRQSNSHPFAPRVSDVTCNPADAAHTDVAESSP